MDGKKQSLIQRINEVIAQARSKAATLINDMSRWYQNADQIRINI